MPIDHDVPFAPFPHAEPDEVHGFPHLPSRVWQEILQHLPTLLDVFNTMKAFDPAKKALNADERECEVIAAVLRRQIRTPELNYLVQAMASHKGAENAYFDHSQYTRFKRDVMPASRYHLLGPVTPSLTFAEAFKQVCIAETVEKLASSFQKNLMEYLIKNDGHDYSFAQIVGRPAESMELVRIGVIMYLVGTYFKHFGKGTEEMSEQQIETHAKRFFYHMPPWEKEMMMTVMEAFTEIVIESISETASKLGPEGEEWLRKRMNAVSKHPLMKRLIEQKKLDWKRTGEWDKGEEYQRHLQSRVHIRVVAWKDYPQINRILKTTKQNTRRRRWDDLFNQGPKWSIMFEHFAAQHEVFPPPRKNPTVSGTVDLVSPTTSVSTASFSAPTPTSGAERQRVRTDDDRAKLRRRRALFDKIHEKAGKMTDRRLWTIRQELSNPEFNEFFRKEHSCDPDEGPAKSWQRAHLRVRGPRWVCNPKMAELRRCGYVFWDRKRFQGRKNIWVRQPQPIDDDGPDVEPDVEEDGGSQAVKLAVSLLAPAGASMARPVLPRLVVPRVVDLLDAPPTPRATPAFALTLATSRPRPQLQPREPQVVNLLDAPPVPRATQALALTSAHSRRQSQVREPQVVNLLDSPPAPGAATASTSAALVRLPDSQARSGTVVKKERYSLSEIGALSLSAPISPKPTPAASHSSKRTANGIVKRETHIARRNVSAPIVVIDDDDDDDEIKVLKVSRVKRIRGL